MHFAIDGPIITVKPDKTQLLILVLLFLTFLAFFIYILNNFINTPQHPLIKPNYGSLLAPLIPIIVVAYIFFDLKVLRINQHSYEIEIVSFTGLNRKTFYFKDVKRFLIEFYLLRHKATSYCLYISFYDHQKISLFPIYDLENAKHNAYVLTSLISCEEPFVLFGQVG